jgi:long-chain acyl-CoA synthetase
MQLDPSDLVLENLYRWAKERPGAVYMTQPIGGGAVRDFTWADTLDQARRMASYLRSFGFPPGSKIAIVSKNCAHFILSDLAIWMAGYVSVALYPTLNAKTVKYILEHSESKLLFVGKLDTWDEMKDGVPAGLPCVTYPLSPPTDHPTWEDIIAESEPISGPPTRAADDSALLIYTSGSTGVPKGVEHTFRTTCVAAKGFLQLLPLTADDRVLSYLPLAHAFERTAIEFLSFKTGMRIYFAESLETFLADMQRARPTLFQSVPRLWLKFQLGVFAKVPEQKLARLLKIPILSYFLKKKILKGLGLDQARLAVSGSAPIPPSLIQWYQDLGLELLEGYAMSENFSYSHLSLPGKARIGYVGHCVPGAECRISEIGEVEVKSPATMKGYYKEPAQSRECMTADGFLKTGDRGEIDDQGRLKITGRVKELFKTSKGKYIAPAPLENLLNADSKIELSCVSGSGMPQPYAVVMLAEDLRRRLAKDPALRAEIDAGLTRLLAEVNAQVEEYEQLAFIAVTSDEWGIPNGYLTPTMKLKRDAVEARYNPLIEAWYDARKPVIWQS